MLPRPAQLIFFFNDTATTEIYTLSLHDALPISDTVILSLIKEELAKPEAQQGAVFDGFPRTAPQAELVEDRKSTRLNSSHSQISYAVFCLKKKKRRKFIFGSASFTPATARTPYY